jgi:hypothetical protein
MPGTNLQLLNLHQTLRDKNLLNEAAPRAQQERGSDSAFGHSLRE